MSRFQDMREMCAAGRNRVVIENVRPQVDGGRFAIKRVAGDIVHVEADIFTDGHDVLSAEVLYRESGGNDWQRAPMTAQINDVWAGEFKVNEVGEYQYRITAWIDHFGGWRRDLRKR